jgi:hypothetical protein
MAARGGERAIGGLVAAGNGLMAAERAADMPRIETAEQYREAVEEIQLLEKAGEGSPGFERRRALQGALADYESRRIPRRPPGIG